MKNIEQNNNVPYLFNLRKMLVISNIIIGFRKLASLPDQNNDTLGFTTNKFLAKKIKDLPQIVSTPGIFWNKKKYMIKLHS